MEYKLIHERNSPRLVTVQYLMGIYHQSRFDIFPAWYKTMFFHYQGSTLRFYVPKYEFDNVVDEAEAVVARGDKKFIRWYGFYRDNYFPHRAVALAKQIKITSLKRLSNRVLISLLQKSFSVFLEDIYLIHLVPFEYGFANYLRRRLETYGLKPLEVDDYLSQLAIAEKPSQVLLEEKAFLKLIVRARRQRLSKVAVAVLIDSHFHKYRFYLVAHGNRPATRAYFAKRWQELVHLSVSMLQARIRKTSTHEHTVTKAKNKIYRRLHADRRFIIASYLFSGLGLVRDRNKAVLGEVLYAFNLILNEVRRRFAVPPEHFNYYSLDELVQLVSKRRYLPPAEVSRRRRSLVIVYHHDQKKKLRSKREIYTGAAAEKVLRTRIQQSITFAGTLEGIIASIGKAHGRVKIVLGVQDVFLVKHGDIMVAPGTDYEMVPAMKKAGAIVTDEGGLLSHAAIVSREFKKPCVIGTKIATKVFKDGDMVEVNALKGVIRKINKK